MIRLTLTCPHCKADVEVEVGGKLVAITPLSSRPIARLPEVKKTKSVCACGHGREWHAGDEQDGKCGHCSCPRYHSGKQSRSVYREHSAANGAAPKPVRGLDAEARILAALVGYDDRTREDLTVLTGYKKSYRDLVIQALERKELVSTAVGGFVVLTVLGREASKAAHAPPVGRDLLQFWIEKLREGLSTVLGVVANHDGVTREQLGELTGYKKSYRDLLVQGLKKYYLVRQSHGGALVAHHLLLERSS